MAETGNIDNRAKNRSSRQLPKSITDGRIAELLLRVVLWVIFSVIIGLLPFLTKLQKLYVRNSSTDLQTMFSDGSLFVVSSIVAASAVGELVINLFRQNSMKRGISILGIIIFGATMIIIYFGGSSFADIMVDGGAFLDHATKELSKERVASLSVNLFICAILSGLGCLFVAEVCKWSRK